MPGGSGAANTSKMTCLAGVAERKGIDYILPDWTALPSDPVQRLQSLKRTGISESKNIILAGSSLGAYISAVFAHEHEVNGLFLLAPILGKNGYQEGYPAPISKEITIIAALEDEYTNPEDVRRFADATNAALHLLPGGHSLENHLGFIDRNFDAFLDRINKKEQGESHFRPVSEEKNLISVEDEGREFLLHPNAARKWLRMKIEADAEGIQLQLVSAFRSIVRQAEIIEKKRNKGLSDEEIFKVNAHPGFSEHHSGRAIDITTSGIIPLEEEFEDTDAFKWLKWNASRFGFYLSYPRRNKSGFAYEPWHWLHIESTKSASGTGQDALRRRS